MSFGRDMARGATGGLGKLLIAAVIGGIVLGALFILGLIWATEPAHSQERDRAAWFESLKQPNTGMSCCDVSDCRVTEAIWQAGGWWAKLPGGQLVAVPPEKVLQAPLSIDGDAYLCSAPSGTIYCFVPPPQGF